MGILSKKGRPSKIVEYFDVELDNNKYTIGTVVYKNTFIKFVIDFEDKNKVAQYSWHKCSNYLASSQYVNGCKKEIFLHNLIMNKLTFEGKGQRETVDHINRNPLDNRKCNLRIVSQSMQNMNKNKRTRRGELPECYNIDANSLPKNISYVKARGNHGDGFCVEFKKDGKKIYNPYIRSKVLTIEEKLEKIKVLLQQGYELHPEFNPEYENENRINLEREFQNIINGASQSTPASTFLNTE
jgi:ribulose bisphosphate carboxylase small subunit